MIPGRLALYLHTVRYLKPSQIWFQLLRRLHRPRRRSGGVFSLRPGVALLPALDQAPRRGGPWHFTFLNVTREFAEGKVDWRSAGQSKLWRYNLHYFDYLNDDSRSLQTCTALIDDWIADNPPGTPDAWEPFPVSLRIVNWIKFFLGSGRQEGTGQSRLRSLHDQALWLERNLELHILANHYFKNLVALTFAGAFFTGGDAERWLAKGLKGLREQLEQQILPDGMHFERSPMYHAMILADCLDLLNLGRSVPREFAPLSGQLDAVCTRMLEALFKTSHPDGAMALFNDAAFGIEASPRQLARYYRRLTGREVPLPAPPLWQLPDAGYYVMAPDPQARLIIDCGFVGPDYQPGHAHCDTLSFELSHRGRRIVVDSGCGAYPEGELRRYNRGNAGHNTLTLDAANQSEVWGAHRVARRARPLGASLERLEDGTLRFEGAHDGYRRLYGSPVHRRTVTWREGVIAIDDQVTGGGSHSVELRLHLNPELQAEAAGGAVRVLDGEKLLATVSLVRAGGVELTSGWYCPEFGLQLPCPLLVVRHPCVQLPFRCGWRIELA